MMDRQVEKLISKYLPLLMLNGTFGLSQQRAITKDNRL